jgi:hypothetical protein
VPHKFHEQSIWQIVVGWDIIEGSLWDIHWDSCG